VVLQVMQQGGPCQDENGFQGCIGIIQLASDHPACGFRLLLAVKLAWLRVRQL
jgi:hypothetical protein